MLTQLLGRSDQRLLQHACLACHHLAGVPHLLEVLGRADVVPALVGLMRRWYDSPPTEQRAYRATGEWAMAALVRLVAPPPLTATASAAGRPPAAPGVPAAAGRNLTRLAAAFKDPQTALGGSGRGGGSGGVLGGFGYAMTQVPGLGDKKVSRL